MSKKSWRNLEVDGVSYQFRMGRGNAVIKFPDGKSHVVSYSTLSGRIPYVIERGQDKKTVDGMMNPSMISRWIKK